LRLRRDGRTLRLVLPREVVPPDTVRAERRGGLLWIRIDGFANDTDRHLAEALAGGLAAGDMAGVVLDLRGNRGGLLGQAVSVASAFLSGGPIARTAGRHPDADRVYLADDEDRARGLPVAVLVDGRSASAAEIVAAALSDRGRAVAVGSATMGKGLIQVVAPLPNGAELHVSWARVLAPTGWPIQGLGVLPAVCTSLGEEALSALLLALRRGESPMEPTLRRARLVRAPAPAAELSALRAACPPAEGREADQQAARAVLEAPSAYAAALAR
jgi:carboxyl-terminal processing protease